MFSARDGVIYVKRMVKLIQAKRGVPWLISTGLDRVVVQGCKTEEMVWLNIAREVVRSFNNSLASFPNAAPLQC